jgi:hypothetical protein
MSKTGRRKPVKRVQAEALAVARRPTRLVVRDPSRLLPAKTVDDTEVGNDGMLIGALGRATFKLTAAQERILNRPVPIAEVLIKPTGQVYLSHPSYTKWFNEAFGRGQWALVPSGKPVASGNSVNVPYMLYINGTPAAFAMGEQEYHEGNKQQTLGDAIEATAASGLRRCAKRLGVGLELWDRAWATRFVAEHGVAVRVSDGKGTRVCWRLKTDPALRGEVSVRGTAVADVIEGQVEPEPAYTDRTRQDTITPKQEGRLFAIAKSVGRTRSEIELWLNRTRGYEHAGQIKRAEYDSIITRIEQKGAL